MLHGVTGCYKVLHGVTMCYTVLQCVTWCYMVLQGVTVCYSVLRVVKTALHPRYKPTFKCIEFATLEITIIIVFAPHPPPAQKKFCITVVFSFPWDNQLKTMVMQNFGGDKKIIMVFSKVANWIMTFGGVD